MIRKLIGTIIILVLVVLALGTSSVKASHSWGNYHWARTSNPFNLNLGDNLSSAWDLFLATTSTDWSVSDVLDTTVVAGQAKRNCPPTSGRVEVCNAKYGRNGWLGLAQIWVSGDHIYQGVTKVNDTYFNTSTYNTPGWRNLVMCQEVGHPLGLDHQDENFDNANLGTCMDYTSNPYGPPSNEHPNAHDYEQLEIIYEHLDSITTISQTINQRNGLEVNLDNPSQWGKLVKSQGRIAVYERDFGGGYKAFTFVIWAD